MNPSYYSAILQSSILDIDCHICIHCRKAKIVNKHLGLLSL